MALSAEGDITIKFTERFLASSISDWHDFTPNVRQQILSDIIADIPSHYGTHWDGHLSATYKATICGNLEDHLARVSTQQEELLNELGSKKQSALMKTYRIGQSEVDENKPPWLLWSRFELKMYGGKAHLTR